MALEFMLQSGSSRSQRKALAGVSILVDKTLGISVGINDNEPRPVSIKPDLLDNAPPLVSGPQRIQLLSGNVDELNVTIKSILPLPMHIMGIYPTMKTHS
jgi:hypothetical protein